MTLTKKQFIFLTALFTLAILSGLLLLCGCGEKNAPEGGEGSEYLLDEYGNWSTDGNIWIASSGDAWSTDGNYWYSYSYAYPQVNEDTGEVQLVPVYNSYVTDGDLYATYGNAPQNVPYATDGNAEPTNEVLVTNVDELLAALAPDTRIILAPGTYNLNLAVPSLYNYCYFRPSYDEEHELVICNLYNCIIEGQGGDGDTVITQWNHTAPVLSLEQCNGLQLRNLTLGHLPGSVCQGGVIRAREVYGLYVEDCDLYGCGTWGLDAEYSYGLTLQSCHIHDCSYGAVSAFQCESILLKDCLCERTGQFSTLSFTASGWVEVEGCTFRDNSGETFLSADHSYKVFLDHCTVEQNTYRYLYSALFAFTEPELNGCTFRDNTLSGGEMPGTDGLHDSRTGGVIVDGELRLPGYVSFPVLDSQAPIAIPPTPQPEDGASEELANHLVDFMAAYMKGDGGCISSLLSHPERLEQLGVWTDAGDTADVISFLGVMECAALEEGGSGSVIITFQPEGYDSYLYMTVQLTRTATGWSIEYYQLDA